MEEVFPKFQYSVFSKNGFDAQYVVRTNNEKEFDFLVAFVKARVELDQKGLTTNVKAAFAPAAPDMQDVTPVELGVCKKCGAPTAYNPKTGKIFCSKKCWLNA